jgi:predicted aspartyl protease
MIIALLLLFSASLLNVTPSPVFADAYIGAAGPYRFLVDTGAQTSLIDPQLAAKLGLKPEFRVELLTQHSTQLVPGTKLTTLKLGDRVLPETEVLFHDVTEARRLDPSVNGVLGLNALTSFDFTLLPATGRLEDTAERPIGEVVPFFQVEGRMAIKARMGEEILTLILDSGSNHVVLFRLPAAMAKVRPVSTTITTIVGARHVVPTCWSADMVLTDRLRIGTLPAAIVQANGTQVEGLLPVSIFKKVHVDQSRHELIVVR